MAFLKEKTGPFEYLSLRYKLSRDQYERYQRKLNCRAVTYLSDGHVVRGWLVHPKTHGDSRLPVIIFNRTGNRATGAVTFGQLFAHMFPLAERGYLVAVSQYRGVIPKMDEMVSPDQFGGDDVRDVTQLMRVVAALPQADPNNFFMIGDGRGAIMSFRALLNSPVPVRAVAIYSGIYDLHELRRFRPEFEGVFRDLIPGYEKRAKAELDKRSVSRWTARLPAHTGVLVLHSEDDEHGPPYSARDFAEQLKRLGRPHKAIFYRGKSYLDPPNEEVRAEVLAWFRDFRH